MGARFDTCHDTCLQLASAGYLLWYRRAVCTSLYHSKYAARIGLTRCAIRPLMPAIFDGTDARSARLCTIENTRAFSLSLCQQITANPHKFLISAQRIFFIIICQRRVDFFFFFFMMCWIYAMLRSVNSLMTLYTAYSCENGEKKNE